MGLIEEGENEFWWIFGRVTLRGTPTGCRIHRLHQRFFDWWNFARNRNLKTKKISEFGGFQLPEVRGK
jgi:hypothetical protein